MSRFRLTAFRLTAALLTATALAACAPRRPPPVPVPAPPPVLRPAPTPAPPPLPPPAIVAWADAALSVGAWTYARDVGASVARFGPAAAPTFSVRCNGDRSVSVTRFGASTGATLTFRSSSTLRSLPAAAGDPAGLTATVSANDPLLDALVFSRGRFAVEAEGLPRLIVPTWPEAARVVEDCRR